MTSNSIMLLISLIQTGNYESFTNRYIHAYHSEGIDTAVSFADATLRKSGKHALALIAVTLGITLSAQKLSGNIQEYIIAGAILTSGYCVYLYVYRGVLMLKAAEGNLHEVYRMEFGLEALMTIVLIMCASMGMAIIELCIAATIVRFCSIGLVIDRVGRLFSNKEVGRRGENSHKFEGIQTATNELRLTYLIDKLGSDGINIFLSALVGASVTAIYATSRQISNAYVTVSTIISSAIIPEVQASHARGERDMTNRTLNGVSASIGLAAAVVVILGALLIEPLYLRWTGKASMYNGILIYSLIASSLFLAANITYVLYFRGTNQKNYMREYACVKCLILGLAAFTAYRYGIEYLGAGWLVFEIVIALSIIPLHLGLDNRQAKAQYLEGLVAPSVASTGILAYAITGSKAPIVGSGAIVILISIYVAQSLPISIRKSISRTYSKRYEQKDRGGRPRTLRNEGGRKQS